MKDQWNPYKILQSILEKIKERADEARHSKDQEAAIRAILDNQERLAEALLVVGALLDVIVDKQITVLVRAPAKGERS